MCPRTSCAIVRAPRFSIRRIAARTIGGVMSSSRIPPNWGKAFASSRVNTCPEYRGVSVRAFAACHVRATASNVSPAFVRC
jgi:hypothetical protein